MGGGKSTTNVAEQIAGIQIQTSSYGGPLPIVYGTSRVAGNLVDYDDFTPIAHTDTQKVGKGGGGSTMTSITWTYTAGIILAICEGPVAAIKRVWRDKEILSGPYSLGMAVHLGTWPQAADTAWASKHPTKAIAYAGMANVVALALDLGSSGAMRNHTFEVRGFLATEADPAVSGCYDAKPHAILLDLATSAIYGAGLDPSRIAALDSGAASYARYCQACGFVLSPVLDDQKATAEHIQDILDATNAEAVWSAGTAGMSLKVIPYGDAQVTGNGATYIPNTSPLYDLGPDDFLGVVDENGEPTGNDAVTVTRTSQQDVFNTVPVEFWDRTMDYNANTVEDPEPVDVAQNGMRKDQPRTLHSITRPAHALQVSRILAQRNVYVRNSYSFRVGWRYILLEPMDLVTITDPALGLDRKVVRIRSVEMPDETSEAEGLTIEAEEWPFGTGTPTVYWTQSGDGAGVNAATPPGDCNPPVIFDVPAPYRQQSSPEVMIGTSGGPNWGGCEVWISADGDSYAFAGRIRKPSRHGFLTGTLAAGSATWDTTSSLPVDLSVSAGELVAVPEDAAHTLSSLCYVGGELLAYQDAALTGPNAYTLTKLERSTYGTTQASHLAGTPFMRLDDAPLRVTVPEAQLGKPVFIKLAAFNVWGLAVQDVADLEPYSFTPEARDFPAPGAPTIAISETEPA